MDEFVANNNIEELKYAQNKERKELQAKITALKHSVTKNDKKKKKEVAKEIEELEAAMKHRHSEELRKLEQEMSGFAIDHDNTASTMNPADMNGKLEERGDAEESHTTFFKETSMSKAQQKKENKRKKQAKLRAQAIVQDEEGAEKSHAKKELASIVNALEQLNCQLFEVEPDGDCLYNALAHQCKMKGLPQYAAVDIRQMAADYIRQNKNNFVSFLIDIEFDSYCDQVEKMCAQGGSWGGEAELQAISSKLARRIEVIQADGQKALFGEQFANEPPIILTFHRHAYTLGEHYNSTEPLESTAK